MPAFTSVGDLLKELMRRRGLTAAALADLARVKLRTLNSYLQGERGMPAKVGLQLFFAMGWPEDSFWDAWREFQAGRPVIIDEDSALLYAAGWERTTEFTFAGQKMVVRERPRLERNLPLSIREYLAEFRLRLTKGGASEEEIHEALELMQSPQVFTFYKGGALSEFNEDQVLRGMKAIGEGVVIPELNERGRKIS